MVGRRRRIPVAWTKGRQGDRATAAGGVTTPLRDTGYSASYISVNQNIQTISLRIYITGGPVWGQAAGTRIAGKLRPVIDTKADLVRISLATARGIDVNFAAEALVGVIAAYRGQVAICLVDVDDADVRANVAAAALREGVPVTAWSGVAAEVLGPWPSRARAEALALVLGRGKARAPDIAAGLGISVSNASSRLKDLFEQGYLARRAERRRRVPLFSDWCVYRRAARADQQRVISGGPAA